LSNLWNILVLVVVLDLYVRQFEDEDERDNWESYFLLAVPLNS